MKINIANILPSALLLLGLQLSVTAQAEDNQEHMTNRCMVDETQNNDACRFNEWYVQLGVGSVKGDLSITDVTGLASDAGFDVFDVDIDDTRTGWQLAVGTALSEQWNLEVGYVDLGEVDTAFTTITNDPDAFFSSTNNIHPVTADGFVIAVEYQIVEDYDYNIALSLGAFIWDGEYSSRDVFNDVSVPNFSDDSGVDVTFGVSADYHLSESWDVGIAYDHYNFGDEDAQLISVNVKYYF